MPKRLLLKVLMMLVIFFSIALYVISIKSLDRGKLPGQTLSDKLRGSFPDKDDFVPDGLSALGGEKDIYSWQDGEGAWHFSTEQPQGYEAEIIGPEPGE